MQQGLALETLGHAIEYLVDSRIDDRSQPASEANAVHILMGCSRAVFEDCEQVLPFRNRIQNKLLKRIYRLAPTA